MKEDIILGIWDGHDAGIAIIQGNNILFAINEERITRNKLDVGFPIESLKFSLNYLNLNPADIKNIAVSTSDFSKTLTRYLPNLKDQYYKLRRRKCDKPKFLNLKRYIKYKLTEIPSGILT